MMLSELKFLHEDAHVFRFRHQSITPYMSAKDKALRLGSCVLGRLFLKHTQSSEVCCPHPIFLLK